MKRPFDISACQLPAFPPNGILAAILLADLFLATAVAAEWPGVRLARESAPVEVLQMVEPLGWRPRAEPMAPLRDHLYLEITGARVQTEAWLRTAGVSLLEEHDPEGHASFTLLSGALTDDSSAVRLRVRFGRPELAAGLHLRQNTATVGMVIPWQHSVFELEAVNDRRLGYAFLASMHWQDAHDRFQWGVAVPLAASGVAVLLQLRMRFDQ